MECLSNHQFMIVTLIHLEPYLSLNLLRGLLQIAALDTNLKIYCFFTATTTTNLELVVKTNCVGEYSGTKDGLLFTFCNGGQCCSTDEIKLSDNCTIPDVFGSSKTGACKDFDFESESMVTGNVTYFTLDGADGWDGEWVKLISYDGASLLCPIYGWIAGHSGHSTYQDFSCSYGKYDSIRPTYGYELFFFESLPHIRH